MSSSGGGVEPRMRETVESPKTSRAFLVAPNPLIGCEKSIQESVVSQAVTAPETATSGSPSGENQVRLGNSVVPTLPLPKTVKSLYTEARRACGGDPPRLESVVPSYFLGTAAPVESGMMMRPV